MRSLHGICKGLIAIGGVSGGLRLQADLRAPEARLARGSMGLGTMKNIWNGYYLRSDGRLVYVIDTVRNIDTGEQVVVCRYGGPKEQHYYVVGKSTFTETLEENGRRVPRYRRISSSRTLSEVAAEQAFVRSGEYPPAWTVRKKKPHGRNTGDPYILYAKGICESYLRDIRLCREGASVQAAEGDYEHARERVHLLEQCMGGPLSGYAAYFRERFVEGKSIRKYAEEHGINRGSVDHIQKKFYSALAEYLRTHGVKISEGQAEE